MKVQSWLVATVCAAALFPQTGHTQSSAPYYFTVSGYGTTQQSALHGLMAEIRIKCRKASSAQLVPGTVHYSPYVANLIQATGTGVCDLGYTFPEPPPLSTS